MSEDDPKQIENSSDSDFGDQESAQSSDSTPNGGIEAPKSDWFNKIKPSETIPDENIEAPNSQWLTEGFDFDQLEPDDQ